MVAKSPTGAPKPVSDAIHWGRKRWEAAYGLPGAAMETTSSLVRVREILVEHANGILAGVDMNFVEYDILNVIELVGGGSMPLGRIGENSRRYFNHQTSVTNLVSRLVERGYVALRKDTSDGRVTLAEMSPLGRRRLKRAHQLLAAVDFGLEGLDEGEMAQLNALLFRVRVFHGDA